VVAGKRLASASPEELNAIIDGLNGTVSHPPWRNFPDLGTTTRPQLQRRQL